MDNASNEAGVRVERGAAAAGPFAAVASVGAGATSYLDPGLAASTTYHYRVVAYNAAGDSPASNIASTATLAAPVAPAAPTNLTATALSVSSIGLAWTDVAANEADYRVQRSASPTTGFADIATLSADTTSYTNTMLPASTTYYYRVYATNAAGSSAFSNTANATTQTPVLTPLPPSNLIATAISSSSVGLTWTDNASNEVNFSVQRSTSPTTGFTTVATPGANSTSYTNTGLAPNTTYYYRVTANNLNGPSPPSNVDSATTPAGATMTLTVNPSNDNLIIVNSQNASAASTAYPSSDLAAGCNWLYSGLTGIQDYVCFASFLRFNVQTQIANKNIVQARLRLYVYALPASYTTYKLWAVAGAWNGATLTWNNMPQVYLASPMVLNQPTTGALPYDVDVTNIVQNWANGSWMNQGFMLEDNDYVFPYATQYRATGFCSNDYYTDCGGPAARPTLFIEYQ